MGPLTEDKALETAPPEHEVTPETLAYAEKIMRAELERINDLLAAQFPNSCDWWRVTMDGRGAVYNISVYPHNREMMTWTDSTLAGCFRKVLAWKAQDSAQYS